MSKFKVDDKVVVVRDKGSYHEGLTGDVTKVHDDIVYVYVHNMSKVVIFHQSEVDKV
jgi:hypothetical protein